MMFIARLDLVVYRRLKVDGAEVWVFYPKSRDDDQFLVFATEADKSIWEKDIPAFPTFGTESDDSVWDEGYGYLHLEGYGDFILHGRRESFIMSLNREKSLRRGGAVYVKSTGPYYIYASLSSTRDKNEPTNEHEYFVILMSFEDGTELRLMEPVETMCEKCTKQPEQTSNTGTGHNIEKLCLRKNSGTTEVDLKS